MGSDYSDIEELFSDKPRTISVTEDTTNKRTRGIKRKAQTSTCSASATAPPTRAKQNKKSKCQSESVQEFNVDKLKNQLGMDRILQSLSSPTDTVNQLGVLILRRVIRAMKCWHAVKRIYGAHFG